MVEQYAVNPRPPMLGVNTSAIIDHMLLDYFFMIYDWNQNL